MFLEGQKSIVILQESPAPLNVFHPRIFGESPLKRYLSKDLVSSWLLKLLAIEVKQMKETGWCWRFEHCFQSADPLLAFIPRWPYCQAGTILNEIPVLNCSVYIYIMVHFRIQLDITILITCAAANESNWEHESVHLNSLKLYSPVLSVGCPRR